MKRGTFKIKLRKPLKRTKINKRSKSPLAKLKNELWQLCRKMIKQKYAHECYTCGKTLVDGQQDFHIGHFISSSICSTELRYDLDNLRPQCSGCNVWKSGNWIAYEQRLIIEHGENYVKDLKEKNQRTKGLKYDELWYKDKIKEYETKNTK